MNRITKIFLMVAICVSTVGCYNDYGVPPLSKIYTDADFADSKIMSIKDFKQMFYDAYGTGTENFAKSLPITEDIIVRGKVISSDKDGNVYKSLYIYDADGESAIELRLMPGNFVYYHPGQMVYVKAKGLVIGSYRGMLSIGSESLDPEYANSNIENPNRLAMHILKGAQGELMASDTLVVNATNYKSVLSEDALGRLVRFEGVTSRFATVGWGYKNSFPSYFSTTDLEGFDWDPSLGWEPTWARMDQDGRRLYGSALFTYGNLSELAGCYVVRSSGYASFRDFELPADGVKADITAIYVKYASKSGNPTSIMYQLTLNSNRDVKVYE